MRDGRHKDKYRAEKAGVPILAREIDGEAIVVTRAEVKTYVENPLFLQALQYWNYTKLWGMPHGNGGWAEEPEDVLRAITAIELESKAMESEEIEKARTQHPKK